MAERPIFVPTLSGDALFKEVLVDFKWHAGFAPSQKKKSVQELHAAAATRGLPRILEVSTKSDSKLGNRLSAFNLQVELGEGLKVPLECAYQGSKKFARGGPFPDLYSAEPREAKRDLRLKESGPLVEFFFAGKSWPISPVNAFYDWLYLYALKDHADYLERLFDFDGFSDIEFNPERSINCQARSCAILVSLLRRRLFPEVVLDRDHFIQMLKGTPTEVNPTLPFSRPTVRSFPTALLGEVFKKSGVPTHTFVAPVEYDRVLAALQTAGRGIVVEGPSGIGKTSCIKRALSDLGLDSSCLFLSARKVGDVELIGDLPSMRGIGVVVIDDFHRLPTLQKKALTDFVKTLADEEDESSKVILIGINRAGQTLVQYAGDLLHRVETIRFGRANVERIGQLISLGEAALNCSIAIADEIAEEAEGSFAIAQVLCNEACLQAGVLQTNKTGSPLAIAASLPSIREAVLADFNVRFFPVARDFATGNKLRREGRAPYLNLLRWLSQTAEGALDTRDAITANPDLKGSVLQVIDKGHLDTLISTSPQIDELIHFDHDTRLLTAEDPKFLYFVRHLIWSKFAKQVGYFAIDFNSKYDVALSFAGENREVAELINSELANRHVAVFYDKNEQYRILANDVEEYLAPIYRSESRFVLALLSKEYPRKLWTKFESDQFKQRFGEGSVIPIWFTDAAPGMFDESRKVGGMAFDTKADVAVEVAVIVDQICKRLEEERQLEAAIS